MTTRSPFTMTFVRCVRTTTAPSLVAALVGLAAAWWLARARGAADSPGATSPWLHLPLFVAAVGCAGTAATFWPAFARLRPGADWIAQRQRGPWRGSGAAVLGALAAQAVLTLPMTVLLPVLLGAPTAAAVFTTLTPPRQALLREPGDALELHVGARLEAVELRLRPLAGPPTGPLQPTHLRVLASVDAEPATEVGDAVVEQTGQHLHVRFGPTWFDRVRIVHDGGNVPLVFPPGGVVAVAAAKRSTIANGLLAAFLFLLPAFTALATGALCGRFAAMPTVLGATFVLLFVQTLAGAGPTGDVPGMLLRGQWLLSNDTLDRSLPSLIAGALAMIGALPWSRPNRT